MHRITRLLLVAAAMVLPAFAPAQPGTWITVASTTSTEASGLFDYLLPRFTADTGIEVRVVAVGTGQAIRLAENGDADVLFVHHPASERAFVEAGYGVKRHPVMHNDFVLVGPADDPAGIDGMTDAGAALKAIAGHAAVFASRGDDSGTHKKELALWKAAGIDPTESSGLWYRETGSGMGATLNVASGLDAYALTDRATWINFGNKGSLEILVQGDPELFNPYGVILVNPALFPHVKAEAGQAFVDWLISPRGQALIADFRIGGQQAFFPDAVPEAGGETAG